MKLHFIKPLLFFVLILSIIATGCLKDSAYNNGDIQSIHSTGPQPQIVEIKLTAGDASNFLLIGVNSSNSDTVINLVPINLATANPASQDVHVTVSLDSNVVVTYDTTGTAAGTPGGDYTIPPSSVYTIVNPVVTIPNGSHTGYLQIKFKPSDFIGHSYALGFRITAVQESGYTISGNLSTGMVGVVIKNPYEGTYTGDGTIYRFNGTTEGSGLGVPPSFPISGSALFSTVTGNSIDGTLPIPGFSPVQITLVINADNSVTITPSVLNAAGVPAHNNPSKPSTYNPATNTFDIHGAYINSTPALREFDCTLTKQ